MHAPADLKERWFPNGVKDGFGPELLDFLRSIDRGNPMECVSEEDVRDLAYS